MGFSTYFLYCYAVLRVLGDEVGFMVLFCASAGGRKGDSDVWSILLFFQKLVNFYSNEELTFSDINVLLIFSFKGKPMQMPYFYFYFFLGGFLLVYWCHGGTP